MLYFSVFFNQKKYLHWLHWSLDHKCSKALEVSIVSSPKITVRLCFCRRSVWSPLPGEVSEYLLIQSNLPLNLFGAFNAISNLYYGHYFLATISYKLDINPISKLWLVFLVKKSFLKRSEDIFKLFLLVISDYCAMPHIWVVQMFSLEVAEWQNGAPWLDTKNFTSMEV